MERPGNQELLGASPLEVFRHVIKINPNIAKVNFWVYEYKPIEHTEGGKNPYWLSREEFFEGSRLQRLIALLPEQAQLGIFSKVLLNTNEAFHIPMMDFEIEKSETGLNTVLSRLRHVGISNGWILETGASYHYYGQQLLSHEEWVDFMGVCLLTSIVHTRKNIEYVADPRYIGHSLRRGGNVLRLTSRADKNLEPVVVASL